jgi:MarR family transcriptional regulator, organic hydroperoxide resistance regulator
MRFVMNAVSRSDLYGDLSLSEYLCFAVYSTNLAFGKAYQSVLDPLGLTYTQYVTLIAVSEKDDQTVRGLGKKLFLESNTLTPILKKLDAMGFVERNRDSQDERLVRVNITEKGRRLRAGRPESALSGIMGLDLQEFRQLQAALLKLRKNVLQSRGMK